MEQDLKDLIKGMITIKYEELGNLTMAFNSVETFVNGLIIECEIEENERIKNEELIQSLDPRFSDENFEDLE